MNEIESTKKEEIPQALLLPNEASSVVCRLRSSRPAPLRPRDLIACIIEIKISAARGVMDIDVVASGESTV